MKRIIKKKKICILSDCFPPTKNSAAGMMYNLCKYLQKDNFEVTCLYGGLNPHKNTNTFKKYNLSGLKLFNVKFLQNSRSNNLVIRFFSEIFLSLILSIKILFKTQYFTNIDLIIWYGPSSFLWLPALILKKKSNCKILYIVRDIFPDWMVSVGLIKKGFIYFFLKILSYPQYTIPNIIGVESKSNLEFFKKRTSDKVHIDIIYNWPSLNDNTKKKNIDKNDQKTIKKIFNNHEQIKKNKLLSSIYIGNSGYAQDLENNLNYLLNFKLKTGFFLDIFSPQRSNFNFKSDFKYISWNGIDDYLIPYFISKKDFGIVSLHKDLFSHNLPGKFVTYLQFKLPILCISNKNSEISKIITEYQCGEFIDLKDSIKLNQKKLEVFLFNIKNNRDFFSKNSNRLFKVFFDQKNLKSKIKKYLII